MTVKIVYWDIYNHSKKPTEKLFTNVVRIYDQYSEYSDLDYIAIETERTTKYIIRDDITHIDVKG